MKSDRDRLDVLSLALARRKDLMVLIELRHESSLTYEIYDLVEQAGWTICLADAPEFSRKIPALGSFCYIWRHGATARYASCYSDEQRSKDAILINGLV